MTTTLDTDANVAPVTTSVDAPIPDVERGDLHRDGAGATRELVFELRGLEVRYSGRTAVRDVHLDVAAHEITAFIGPSGCGKTTVLRSLNRMHDTTPGATVHGTVNYHGENLYGPKVDAAEVRRR